MNANDHHRAWRCVICKFIKCLLFVCVLCLCYVTSVLVIVLFSCVCLCTEFVCVRLSYVLSLDLYLSSVSFLCAILYNLSVSVFSSGSVSWNNDLLCWASTLASVRPVAGCCTVRFSTACEHGASTQLDSIARTYSPRVIAANKSGTDCAICT